MLLSFKVVKNDLDLFSDWAYLEEWCRKLTMSFSDVYVFTIPLYLPRLDADGKWRVVSLRPIFRSVWLTVYLLVDT
jgi:DNA/RNA non-specific endonuclease